MRTPQHRGNVFATRPVAHTDIPEMFRNLTGRGAEDVAAERFVGRDVPQQMMGWEQLSPTDALTDSKWNGSALLLGISPMVSAAAAPTVPHRLV